MSDPQRLYKKGFQSLTRREKRILLKSLQSYNQIPTHSLILFQIDSTISSFSSKIRLFCSNQMAQKGNWKVVGIWVLGVTSGTRSWTNWWSCWSVLTIASWIQLWRIEEFGFMIHPRSSLVGRLLISKERLWTWVFFLPIEWFGSILFPIK